MTAIRVIEQISMEGDSAVPNEDIADHSKLAAWTMDGATGLVTKRLLPGPTDACWLVSQYNMLLQAQADSLDVDTFGLFVKCIDYVVQQFETQRLRNPEARFELPSAGIAFVRVAQQRLEYARLGDCRAIFMLPDGAVVSTARSRLHELDERVIAKMGALRRADPARSFADLRAAIQSDLQMHRNLLNMQGGYWALGTAPEAARHLETRSFSLHPGEKIRGLLVTDGFYRLVDTFGIFQDDAALIAACHAQGLRPLLHQLRELEEADAECIFHPRFKVSDDATALLFEAGTAF